MQSQVLRIEYCNFYLYRDDYVNGVHYLDANYLYNVKCLPLREE